MLEKEMRPAVHAWLTSHGYTVIYECLMAGYCDMVGVTFAERVGRRVPPAVGAVAVELKLRDVAGVLLQAKYNRRCVERSYAAMPKSFIKKMRNRTLEKFRSLGVGLLSVDVLSGEVASVVAAGPVLANLRFSNFSRRWWNRTVYDRRLGRMNGPLDTPDPKGTNDD